jgi:hypothetical protein
MGVENELHDEYLASNAFWLWKEQSQASWGVHEYDEATDTWTERDQAVRWVSRVHAARIAGEVVANTYDWETDTLRLETRGARQPHEVYIPERAASTFTITCDGEASDAPRAAATGLVSVECDGVLEVAP